MISPYPFPDQVVQRNVACLLNNGLQVDAVCPPSSHLFHGRLRSHPGLRAYAVPVRHRRTGSWAYAVEYISFFIMALALTSALGLRRRYSTVEVINMPDWCVFCAIVPRWRGARIVLNMLELNPELAMARLGLDRTHPLICFFRVFERLATTWVDAATVVNEACRRALVGRGISPAKITFIPNTQPWVEVGPKPAADRDKAAPVLVTHGTLLERYGVQVAIQSVRELADRGRDVTLQLLGEGEFKPHLVALARRLDVADRVVFRGFVPWDEAIEQVCQATLGLVTVLDDVYGRLLLPTRLLDYVNCGLPVVCSRLGGITEYFPDDSVAYFSPGDPHELARTIERLLSDSGERERRVRATLDAMRRLSWEATVTRYLEIMGAQTPG
jgi:glycosyltransferase involved in cell wall biosynthesis